MLYSPMSSPRRRTAARVAGVGALTVIGLGLPAVAAEAHVTVRADQPAAGSFSQLTFRVPNESDTAGTVKVSVQLPQDTPFRFVSTKPVPGWTVQSDEAPLPAPIEEEGATITKAVRTVTWTAEKGTRIEPGQYQEFSISAGPLPEPTELVLPATQTYSDGDVVSWDQPTPASGEEPEHPAPTVQVVAAVAEPASEAASSASPAPADSAPADPAPAAPAAEPGGADSTARWLAGIALVVGVAAGALGALALRRPGRS